MLSIAVLILLLQNQAIAQLKDVDGNVYRTIKIGSQIWTAENLKTSKFSNGIDIPYVQEDSIWTNLNSSAFCFYEHDQNYHQAYGNLYNFYSVEDQNKLCPNGWDVPTLEDWGILIDFLGGDSIAGGKLKELGFDHWRFPNSGPDLRTGMNVLPGGTRYSAVNSSVNGTFVSIGGNGSIWTSTGNSNSEAISKYFYSGSTSVGHLINSKKYGKSVRCINKNENQANPELSCDSFQVFPNPTKGKSQISVKNGYLEESPKYLIYNTRGQLIKEINNEYNIDLSNEPRQMYILMIVTKSTVCIKKLVVS